MKAHAIQAVTPWVRNSTLSEGPDDIHQTNECPKQVGSVEIVYGWRSLEKCGRWRRTKHRTQWRRVGHDGGGMVGRDKGLGGKCSGDLYVSAAVERLSELYPEGSAESYDLQEENRGTEPGAIEAQVPPAFWVVHLPTEDLETSEEHLRTFPHRPFVRGQRTPPASIIDPVII